MYARAMVEMNSFGVEWFLTDGDPSPKSSKFAHYFCMILTVYLDDEVLHPEAFSLFFEIVFGRCRSKKVS